MKILITGFEPFGGEPINPSWEAVRLVREPETIEFVRIEVPTVFKIGSETVIEGIKRENPDAVLCVGQAAGRKAVSVERVATNIMDARIADNAGQKPMDEPIDEASPAAYFSTLPIKRIVSAIHEAGIPAQISNSAGTFVCNELFYSVLNYLSKHKITILAGFIHVPAIPEQAARLPEGTPVFALSEIVRALEIAIRVVSNEAERTY